MVIKMKTLIVATVIVVALHAITYKMETRSLRSLKTRSLTDDQNDNYLEEYNRFRAELPKNGSLPLIDYYEDVNVGNITIGTPGDCLRFLILGQTLFLLMDTGSSNLWIIDTNCKRKVCDGYFGNNYTRNKFDRTKSSTFLAKKKAVKLNYGYGWTKGILAMDVVSLAGHTIKQQEFVDATDIGKFFGIMPFDGMFGLGWPERSLDKITSPMSNLLPMLDAPLFTVWMDKRSKNGGNAGLITFGAIDTKNCESKIEYVPLSTKKTWQFRLDGFSVGDFSTSKSEEVLSDSGMPFSAVPHHIMRALAKQTHARFDFKHLMYTVDCSTMKSQPDLVFTINGINYTVPSEAYVVDIGFGNGRCALAFFAKFSGGFGPAWILGNSWIRTYCNIYDFGKERIGFAKSIHSHV
ncbi:eukaryotic aspartyl protease [Dictyocaulus viviparus]|uniref:Eukaryotic aspartyl protease n=1 Tax=Dictyocaulus viviparus TaxID=29172 RepID=A0A0D8YAG5_DICVI|nr:eukaryotic aspartyl protease [Dictyocaulus viviparus]